MKIANRKSQIAKLKKSDNSVIGLLDYWSIGLFPFASQGGQALVTLLFFVVMGVTITSAAVVIVLANTRIASKVELGSNAYYIAESGAEEGMVQLLRNPFYSGTETLSLNGGMATVSATQGSPTTILSVGQYNNFIRKVQIQTVYNNGTVTIQSWKEIQ